MAVDQPTADLSPLDRRDFERLLILGRACLDDDTLCPRAKGAEIIKFTIHRVLRERVFLRHKRMDATAGWDSELRDQLFDAQSSALRVATRYDQTMNNAEDVFGMAQRFALDLAKDTKQRAKIKPEELAYLR
jgi:hypothetical protein